MTVLIAWLLTVLNVQLALILIISWQHHSTMTRYVSFLITLTDEAKEDDIANAPLDDPHH